MATVNVNSNPVVPIVGSRDADAVIIQSEQNTSGLVFYQIEKIATSDVYTINTNMDAKKGGNLINVTKTKLKIILESRTKFRVRTKAQFGPYSAWVNFTTRDKRYQSPDAVTQLTDDTDASAQTQGIKRVGASRTQVQGGSRTIRVTNNAKADVTVHSVLKGRKRGAAVINTDTIYNDGQLQQVGNGVSTPVRATPRGATVVNVPSGKNVRIRYTNRGATINTIVG